MHPRLTHVTFQVRDFEESIQFCQKWFGLEIHRDRRPYTVWLSTSNQSMKSEPDFVLVLEKGGTEYHKLNHFGFQVTSREELESLAQRAKQEGILKEGPTDIGGVVGSFVLIEDPNGHIWEFTYGQPLAGL